MDQEPKRLVDKAEEIRTVGRWAAVNNIIKKIASDPEKAGWECGLLSDLCYTNFGEFIALDDAYKDSESKPALLAWRTRNLLEIAVWSKYCTRSTENARLFYEDAGRDVRDLYDVFAAWGKQTGQEAAWLDPIEAAKHQLKEDAASYCVESLEGSYTSVKKAAKECGIGQTFAVAYKLYSKYAHQTAMMITGRTEGKNEHLLRDLLYSQGCLHFENAFTTLEGCLASLQNRLHR